MASRIYDYAESLGSSSYGTDATYQTKVSLTKTPSANSTVFVSYSAIVGNNSLTPLHKTRLYNSTGATVLCEHLRNPKDTTDLISVHGFAIQTFGATPASQTWRIDYGTTSNSGSTSISNARLSYLELDAAEFYRADASTITATDTNRVNVLTLTETLANGVDYYVLCSSAPSSTSTASSGRIQIRAVYNGTDYGSMDYDIGSTSEFLPWWTVLKITGDGTSKTVSISLNSSGTSDVNASYNYIAAFRADKFPGTFYDESRARSTTTTASYQDKVTSTHTPAVKAYLSFACGVLDIGSTTSSGLARFTKGATNYGEHTHEPNTTGASGGAMSYGVGVVETQAASSTTWKTQWQTETGAITAGFAESAVLHLQVEDTSGASITATGIGSTAAIGSASVTPGAVDIAATGVGSTATFGSTTVTATASIAATGITSTAAFGSATVAPGAADIAATGIASATAFGSAGVTATAAIAATAIVTTAVFGSPTVATTNTITTTGIASGVAFGSKTVTPGAVSIAGQGIASGESFGSATVTADAGDQDIAATGIDPTATFGSVAVTALNGIAANAIPSGESFGSPSISAAATVNATGIGSTAVFGSATVAATAEIACTGIGPGTTFGQPTVSPGAVTITATGIPSGASIGQPTVTSLTESGLNVVTVAAQDRTVLVAAEDRTVTVAPDNRITSPAAQPRTITVNSESRVIRVAA